MTTTTSERRDEYYLDLFACRGAPKQIVSEAALIGREFTNTDDTLYTDLCEYTRTPRRDHSIASPSVSPVPSYGVRQSGGGERAGMVSCSLSPSLPAPSPSQHDRGRLLLASLAGDDADPVLRRAQAAQAAAQSSFVQRQQLWARQRDGKMHEKERTRRSQEEKATSAGRSQRTGWSVIDVEELREFNNRQEAWLEAKLRKREIRMQEEAAKTEAEALYRPIKLSPESTEMARRYRSRVAAAETATAASRTEKSDEISPKKEKKSRPSSVSSVPTFLQRAAADLENRRRRATSRLDSPRASGTPSALGNSETVSDARRPAAPGADTYHSDSGSPPPPQLSAEETERLVERLARPRTPQRRHERLTSSDVDFFAPSFSPRTNGGITGRDYAGQVISVSSRYRDSPRRGTSGTATPRAQTEAGGRAVAQLTSSNVDFVRRQCARERQRQAHIEELRQQREVAEREKIDKECTFTPLISPRSARLADGYGAHHRPQLLPPSNVARSMASSHDVNVPPVGHQLLDEILISVGDNTTRGPSSARTSHGRHDDARRRLYQADISMLRLAEAKSTDGEHRTRRVSRSARALNSSSTTPRRAVASCPPSPPALKSRDASASDSESTCGACVPWPPVPSPVTGGAAERNTEALRVVDGKPDAARYVESLEQQDEEQIHTENTASCTVENTSPERTHLEVPTPGVCASRKQDTTRNGAQRDTQDAALLASKPSTQLGNEKSALELLVDAAESDDDKDSSPRPAVPDVQSAGEAALLRDVASQRTNKPAPRQREGRLRSPPRHLLPSSNTANEVAAKNCRVPDTSAHVYAPSAAVPVRSSPSPLPRPSDVMMTSSVRAAAESEMKRRQPARRLRSPTPPDSPPCGASVSLLVHSPHVTLPLRAETSATPSAAAAETISSPAPERQAQPVHRPQAVSSPGKAAVDSATTLLAQWWTALVQHHLRHEHENTADAAVDRSDIVECSPAFQAMLPLPVAVRALRDLLSRSHGTSRAQDCPTLVCFVPPHHRRHSGRSTLLPLHVVAFFANSAAQRTSFRADPEGGEPSWETARAADTILMGPLLRFYDFVELYEWLQARRR